MICTCQNKDCGKEFESKRADAKFCGAACRNAVKRDPSLLVKHTERLPGPSIPKVSDELANMISYCHKVNITPDELIDFHNKYHKKVLLMEKITAPSTETKGSNDYLAQRRQLKMKSSSKMQKNEGN